MSNPLPAIINQKVATLPDTQTYNIKIPFEGAPITNQRSSGRCWLFAATNVFRVAIMKKHNLQSFELSQSYLFFWDKLEKANYFLEQVLDTLDEDLDGRLMQALLASPIGDGGQWDMVRNLVRKYGLVRMYLNVRERCSHLAGSPIALPRLLQRHELVQDEWIDHYQTAGRCTRSSLHGIRKADDPVIDLFRQREDVEGGASHLDTDAWTTTGPRQRIHLGILRCQ